MRECVPVLGNYKTLKAQFDWVCDGEVSPLVERNLGHEIKNMEMYLRYLVLIQFIRFVPFNKYIIIA